MILAADFGGTTIKVGLVEQARVLARGRMEARSDRPMPERLEAVALEWESLLEKTGHRKGDCAGATLALPFLVDHVQGRVRGDFGKFPGAMEIDFGSWAAGRLGLRATVDGDVRMALLGEHAVGAARGKDHVALMMMGTGIGCAAMCDGRVLRGSGNAAATLFGHVTVRFDGAPGRCGNLGCAEDLASTATLGRRAHSRANFSGSALARADRIDFETLCTLAEKGDVCSDGLLAECIEVWSALARNAAIAFDPEVVVLGGGVLRTPDILRRIQERFHHPMSGFPSPPRIVAAELGDDAALIGGEVLFHDMLPASGL